MRNRHDQIAEFYAGNAPDLLRSVRRAISGSDALVEDACQQAWCQLLRHDEVTLDRNGFSWLYVVACRSAFRMSDRMRREPACGEPSELPAAPGRHHDGRQDADRRLEHDHRTGLLAQLPGRQRTLLALQAAGFTYEEISTLTGDTIRTVERQLLRAKRTLRRLQTEPETTGAAA